MDKLTRFRINSPKVIHETIDGETVIVNLDSGNYYSLDKVGAEIWTLIGKGISLHGVIENMTFRYSGQREEIDRVVSQFVDELMQEALIAPLESGGAESGSNPGTEQADGHPNFETPVLRKYSDMQELLLLDPIHEVDDTGWPNVKTTDR